MSMLSWEPKLKGTIYCAPACGRGCTKAEFDAATEAAAELAKMLGPDWKPVVSENLGWHYRAISPCGRIKVHPPIVNDSSYSAFLGEPESPGGHWVEDAMTPQHAVEKVIKTAKQRVAAIMTLIEGL